LDEAMAQFRETVRLKPDHALAHYNLSAFAAEGRYQFPPEDVSRIKCLLASGRSSVMDRSLCAFALAAVQHQQGAYDEAFAYYREANDLRKRFFKERNVSFDARSHEALIDRIMQTYDEGYFTQVRDWGTD